MESAPGIERPKDHGKIRQVVRRILSWLAVPENHIEAPIDRQKLPNAADERDATETRPLTLVDDSEPSPDLGRPQLKLIHGEKTEDRPNPLPPSPPSSVA